MGLGQILKRHNVFQWDLAAAAATDTALDARYVYTLTALFTKPMAESHLTGTIPVEQKKYLNS